MYAITTEVNRKVLFVSDCSKRLLDSKYLVEYSPDEAEATRFTKAEAKTIIPDIHNPFDRDFEITPVTVKEKRVIAAIEDFS